MDNLNEAPKKQDKLKPGDKEALSISTKGKVRGADKKKLASLEKKIKALQKKIDTAANQQVDLNRQKNNLKPKYTAKEANAYKLIKRDCKEFLSACRQAKEVLWRGISFKSTTGDANHADAFVGKPREGRKSLSGKDTSQELFDKYMQKWGFKALRSNSIFTSSREGFADGYGALYYICPKDGFSFTWSPVVTDLYNEMITGGFVNWKPGKFDGTPTWSHELQQLDSQTRDHLFNAKHYLMSCVRYLVRIQDVAMPMAPELDKAVRTLRQDISDFQISVADDDTNFLSGLLKSGLLQRIKNFVGNARKTYNALNVKPVDPSELGGRAPENYVADKYEWEKANLRDNTESLFKNLQFAVTSLREYSKLKKQLQTEKAKFDEKLAAYKAKQSTQPDATVDPDEEGAKKAFIDDYKYTDQNFADALKKQNEIIINGTYYAFRKEHYERLKYLILNGLPGEAETDEDLKRAAKRENDLTSIATSLGYEWKEKMPSWQKQEVMNFYDAMQEKEAPKSNDTNAGLAKTNADIDKEMNGILKDGGIGSHWKAEDDWQKPGQNKEKEALEKIASMKMQRLNEIAKENGYINWLDITYPGSGYNTRYKLISDYQQHNFMEEYRLSYDEVLAALYLGHELAHPDDAMDIRDLTDKAEYSEAMHYLQMFIEDGADPETIELEPKYEKAINKEWGNLEAAIDSINEKLASKALGESLTEAPVFKTGQMTPFKPAVKKVPVDAITLKKIAVLKSEIAELAAQLANLKKFATKMTQQNVKNRSLEKKNHIEKLSNNTNYKATKYFELLEKNCSDYIKACRAAGGVLYRGISTTQNTPSSFTSAPWKDRKPMDVSSDHQQRIDAALTKLGHKALRRNSIFTSGKHDHASDYGSVYLIVPKNGFSFTWSPKVKDLADGSEVLADKYSMVFAQLMEAITDKIEDVIVSYSHTNKYEKVAEDCNVYLRKKVFPLVFDLDDDGSSRNVAIIKKLVALAPNLVKFSKQLPKLKPLVARYISAVKDALKQANQAKRVELDTDTKAVKKASFTNKNLPAAIKSKKEVYINGPYYAFRLEPKVKPFMSKIEGRDALGAELVRLILGKKLK
jgi:hypothetical protein